MLTAAQAGRVDAAAVALRADVADQVSRRGGMPIDVAIEAGDALHADGLLGLAIGGGVELLLGNCVTSRRMPSRSLALRMPPKIS